MSTLFENDPLWDDFDFEVSLLFQLDAHVDFRIANDLEFADSLLSRPWTPAQLDASISPPTDVGDVTAQSMGEVTPSPPWPSHRVSREQGCVTWNDETNAILIMPDLGAHDYGDDTPCTLQVMTHYSARSSMRFAGQGNVKTKKRVSQESDQTICSTPTTHAKHMALYLTIQELQQHDVLLGRSPVYYNQPGNQRFLKVLKATYQSLYKAARKAEKHGIAQRMVNAVHELGGRFMKCEEDGSSWVEVPNEVAREKAAQTLREDLSKAARQLKRLKYPKQQKKT